jgi:hypothetical protein
MGDRFGLHPREIQAIHSVVCSSMRLSWSQHLNAARIIELAGNDHAGEALALMGVALLMLMQDLSAGVDASSDQPCP